MNSHLRRKSRRAYEKEYARRHASIFQGERWTALKTADDGRLFTVDINSAYPYEFPANGIAVKLGMRPVYGNANRGGV